MYIELKIFKFVCDLCGKEEVIQLPSFRRPDGWIGGGPTNPYAVFEEQFKKDICPDCKDLKK